VIVAIDGPAASGKGTIARAVARQFGLSHLDTGLLYRATALALRKAGASCDAAAAAAAARTLTLADLDDPRLRSREIGEAASVVAAIPEVRAALIELQRAFARAGGDNSAGAVLDGRDIGTFICPDADVKLFVTASDETRAQRRTLELRQRGEDVGFEEVLADIRLRDRRDSEREAAPMRQAPDAVALDTTALGIDQAVAAAAAIVAARLRR